MTKNIVIIGGGISGLSLLHYLKIKYQNEDVQIRLLEKESQLGGTIQSISKGGFLFETGPNGFLDSHLRSLDFIKTLGLENELIKADSQSKIRYIFRQKHLHALEPKLVTLLRIKLLTPIDKLKIINEVFVPRGNNPNETVFDFAVRRLGKNFAENFIDPLVTGIYGGDAKRLILRETFPKIHALELEHGSLIKAMFAQKKKTFGQPKGMLTSLRRGMGQIIESIANRYSSNIILNHTVERIEHVNGIFRVQTQQGHFNADHLFLSLPAYTAANLINSIDHELAQGLQKINYSPIAVVGLGYSKNAFTQFPSGYGYLVPSKENKEILGVLFESNIFPGRATEDSYLVRVMLGGNHHPDIVNKPKEQICEIAIKEISQTLSAKTPPIETFVQVWPKAIPQYDQTYVVVKEMIKQKLNEWKNLHIVANYFNGVSFNDCIENAYQTVENLNCL